MYLRKYLYYSDHYNYMAQQAWIQLVLALCSNTINTYIVLLQEQRHFGSLIFRIFLLYNILVT
jgi:hypothetical protein